MKSCAINKHANLTFVLFHSVCTIGSYIINGSIMRAFGVSIMAAYVHDESKEPINFLRSVPSNAWNGESERFFDEVVCKTVALSGMEFFFLTRKLILSVAGTIVRTNSHCYKIKRLNYINYSTITDHIRTCFDAVQPKLSRG